MRNVSEKICRETQNSHFISNNFFLNRAVYEVTWKNIVQLDKTQMTSRCMGTECRIAKVTDKHSEYINIIALTLQQWLHECASMLHYTFIACLVFLITEYSAVVHQHYSLTAYLKFSSIKITEQELKYTQKHYNSPSSTKHLKPVVHFNNIIKRTP
jgi:hypothetical protein